jgi:copper chaperone CopZ
VVEQLQYVVPGIHCAHCERALRDELGAVAGVAEVEVDLETKLVNVSGESLDESSVRAAIAEAGYEAEPA